MTITEFIHHAGQQDVGWLLAICGAFVIDETVGFLTLMVFVLVVS